MTSTTIPSELIGYDDSPDMYDLRVYCADCAGECSAGARSLYADDEWGASEHPKCESCGAILDRLTLVDR